MLELFGAAPEPHLMISLSNVRLQLEFSLIYMGFPVAQMVKNVPAMRETWVRSLGWEDPWIGKIPGLGRSPGEGNSYPLRYSGLENSMDYTVHGVTKSRTGLRNFHIPTISHNAFSVLLS